MVDPERRGPLVSQPLVERPARGVPIGRRDLVDLLELRALLRDEAHLCVAAGKQQVTGKTVPPADIEQRIGGIRVLGADPAGGAVDVAGKARELVVVRDEEHGNAAPAEAARYGQAALGAADDNRARSRVLSLHHDALPPRMVIVSAWRRRSPAAPPRACAAP